MLQIPPVKLNGNGNHNGNGYHKEPVVWPGTAPDKLQPNSVECEEALLGSILINPDMLLDCDEVGLTQEDFFIQRYGWIYAAARKLDYNCDIVSLAEELARQGLLEEIGGSSKITELISLCPTFTNARYYAKIIKQQSTRRSLIKAAGEIARLGFDDEETDPLPQASDILLRVATSNQIGQARQAKFYCNAFLDQLEVYHNSNDEILGLPTGLKNLDNILNGLQNSKSIIIAGRPGMGKSALALQIARSAIKERQAKVLYFSLEMVGEELIERLISNETGIDTDSMKKKNISGPDMAKINAAAEYISRWPLMIDDRTQNIEAIRARAITHKAKYGLDLIEIDYGQRVKTGLKYQNRDSEMGIVSAAIKSLANELQVPVVTVASLSRECEKRNDKRPILSDLRDSGNWEYDADVVIFVYRDDVYNPETEFPNVAEFIVGKHRGGKTGRVSVYFKKHVTTFVDLEVRCQPLDY